MKVNGHIQSNAFHIECQNLFIAEFAKINQCTDADYPWIKSSSISLNNCSDFVHLMMEPTSNAQAINANLVKWHKLEKIKETAHEAAEVEDSEDGTNSSISSTGTSVLLEECAAKHIDISSLDLENWDNLNNYKILAQIAHHYYRNNEEMIDTFNKKKFNENMKKRPNAQNSLKWLRNMKVIVPKPVQNNKELLIKHWIMNAENILNRASNSNNKKRKMKITHAHETASNETGMKTGSTNYSPMTQKINDTAIATDALSNELDDLPEHSPESCDARRVRERNT